MSLMRWEPLTELSRIRQEMDRVFGEFFGAPATTQATSERWIPPVDVYEADNQVVVKAELPGVNKDNLEVTTTEDSVTIKGETKSEQEVKEPSGYYRKELRYGSFQRLVPLPSNVKPQEAKASFKDGILEIRLPKAEEAQLKERRIPIE